MLGALIISYVMIFYFWLYLVLLKVGLKNLSLSVSKREKKDVRVSTETGRKILDSGASHSIPERMVTILKSSKPWN